jgi:hypothetical protein
MTRTLDKAPATSTRRGGATRCPDCTDGLGQHPVSSAAVTLGGLAAAALVFWAVGHVDLVDRGRSALGL